MSIRSQLWAAPLKLVDFVEGRLVACLYPLTVVGGPIEAIVQSSSPPELLCYPLTVVGGPIEARRDQSLDRQGTPIRSQLWAAPLKPQYIGR